MATEIKPDISHTWNGYLEYSRIGPDFLANFPVGRTGDSAVLWLNDRWLIANGFANSIDSVRSAIEAFLLSKFSVCADAEYCLPGSFGEAQLGADRYGAANGALHGGSGRCGAAGGFHAKGIGPTPLVPANVDREHAHGFLPLGDAIREAIVGEVADAELPHGAVPVIAILDAGITASLDPAGKPERCAIVVRPNVLRIAHLERSVFFGSSGFEGSDQHRDAGRVRDTVRWLEHTSEGGQFWIDDLLDRTTRQIGACRAHRLWSGRAASDNLTISGALLDHGCFRALPNWRRSDDGMGQTFGTEAADIENFARSIPAAFSKYGSAAVARPDVRSLRIKIATMLDKGFGDACAMACGLSPNGVGGRAFAQIMADRYNIQQRVHYSLADPVARWQRGDLLLRERGVDFRWLATIAHDAEREEDTPAAAFRHAVDRWSLPRVNLYYHVAKRRVQKLCAALTGDSVQQRRLVGRFIAREVVFGRRLFTGVARHWIVTAHTTDLISAALAVVDPTTRRRAIRLSGPVYGGKWLLFGTRVAHPRCADVGDGGSLALLINLPRGGSRLPPSVDINGHAVPLPKTQMSFADHLPVEEA